jgi:L-aspartate oxidase
MAGVHPLGDLAPRDVVTRAMAARMAATGARHLWLDATAVPAAHLERRFPTILARCRAAGIEPTRQPIPVSPAAHYLMGGVVTDLDGRTTLPGLFAVGEAACTGVHGANRLASNSLLEGVVFAARIGRALEDEGGAPGGAVDDLARPGPGVGYAPPPGDPARHRVAEGRPARLGEVRGRLRRLMTERVGVVRSAEGLGEAVATLERLGEAVAGPEREAVGGLEREAVAGLGEVVAGPERLGAGPASPGPEGFEVANLVQLGRAVAELALRREESRGGHWRSDHPAPVEAWRVRQTLTRTPGGDLEAGLLAVPAAAEVGP